MRQGLKVCRTIQARRAPQFSGDACRRKGERECQFSVRLLSPECRSMLRPNRGCFAVPEFGSGKECCLLRRQRRGQGFEEQRIGAEDPGIEESTQTLVFGTERSHPSAKLLFVREIVGPFKTRYEIGGAINEALDISVSG